MKYEIMFIVRPNLEEAGVKEVAKNFEKVLADNGAKVTSSKDLGQKELAYEVKENANRIRFVYHQGELLYEKGGDSEPLPVGCLWKRDL